MAGAEVGQRMRRVARWRPFLFVRSVGLSTNCRGSKPDVPRVVDQSPGLPRGDNGAGTGAVGRVVSTMLSSHSVLGRKRCQIVRRGVR